MLNNDMSTLALQLFKGTQTGMSLNTVQNKPIFYADQDASLGHANLPSDALMFGIASDGLPLLLRLRNPGSGSILITGERGSGLTSFLKTMVRTARLQNLPRDARYVLLTDIPSKFYDIDPFSHSLEIYPVYQNEAVELIDEISWEIQYQEINRPIVFMIDGFETTLKMCKQAQDNLVNILVNGPQSLVRPLVTMRSEMAIRQPQWLELFGTRIYGHIASAEAIETLSNLPGAPFQDLEPGVEFCLRQQSTWLKFRLPGLMD